MDKESKIYIAGHTGMVGSAILRNLKSAGYNNFLLRSMDELDLRSQADTRAFFEKERPEYVILAAARVGGIVANNTYRAEFIFENLMIQNNVIHASWKQGAKKLLFLGSSCIYPREAPQPLREDYLLTGPLEFTNEPYAIAKIAGIKMCENYFRQYGCNFISVMPTNLYGPNDNYDLEKSHVLPAFIRKMHLGKCLEDNNREALRADLNRYPVEGVDGKADYEEILAVLEKHGISVMAAAGNGGSTESENDRPAASGNDGPASIKVTLWGSGGVYREFLHVDDMAEACIYIMQKVDSTRLYNAMRRTHINIGTGKDITVKELAVMVKDITGFRGELFWDSSKPDGTPKKQLDVGLLHELGWKHRISLREGIKNVYQKAYLG